MLEANTAGRSGRAHGGALTGREREVLAHVERGLTNVEIARRMRIARPTVSRLLSNAMVRLGAASRLHAVVLAGAGAAPGAVPGKAPRFQLAHNQRAARAAAVLDPETRALIGRIAAGDTLGEAARALYLSRRTADRRLADVRRALGVERTVATIVWARRLGWLD